MSCDKTGAVVDRITEGEVDHGQHDAVRDVFVAPGGCILVRADLFAELEGFDAGIVAMGEDLDLSWRSQVAGSRVVVAPDARVRHREVVAGGLEPLVVAGEPDGRHPVTMQSLQRRHELRAVLKCYTRLTLLRVLPQAALLAFGEFLVAVLARDRDRARAVTGAWRWNFRRLTELSVLRGELAEHRLFPDAEVRRLQVRGSARLSGYFSRLSHQGFEAANAVAAPGAARERERAGRRRWPSSPGSVGSAFSEDADFDDLDDLGRRCRTGPLRPPGPDVAPRPPGVNARWPWSSRSSSSPSAPATSSSARCRSSGSWRPCLRGRPVGTTSSRAGSRRGWARRRPPLRPSGWSASPAPSSSAPWGPCSGSCSSGASRSAPGACRAASGRWCRRGPASWRSSVTSVSRCPTARSALGRWDGLVAYAAFPFIALRLARAAGVAPYRRGARDRSWRSRPAGQVVILGAVIAAASAFAPAVFPMVLVMAVAWVLGSLLVGAREPTWRVLVVAVQAVVVALVLALPWVVGTALAGKGSVAIFGLPLSGATAPELG